MSALLSHSLLWSQLALPSVPEKLRPLMMWLFVFGEPAWTANGLLGALLTWLKVVSLFCLLGWVVSWVTAALKERTVARGNWLDIAALIALVAAGGAVALRSLEAAGRAGKSGFMVGGLSVVTLISVVCGIVIFLWLEVALWRTIHRLGKKVDLLVLAGVHLALLFGLATGSWVLEIARAIVAQHTAPGAVQVAPTLEEGLVYGARLSGTYMGYVILLRVAMMILGELASIRWRRIYSIAHLTVIESTRRMWAPWVVITVFLVVLAFTHWFLQPPRPAEMGRLFVGTLSLLCSLLLTVMVTLLTPLSIPHDIQQQTIYTVVSKPVRRIELIWGRMLGFMSIVTVLVAIFGGISLFYLWRTVGGTITTTEELARKEESRNPRQAAHLRDEADQLRARMSAREPIMGSLSFLDSRSQPRKIGIDVGADQSMRSPRSHIEGGTPATAIWQYGVIPDLFNPRILHDVRIPVDRLLTADSIEGLLDRVYNLRFQIREAERKRSARTVSTSEARTLSNSIARYREELTTAEEAYRKKEAEDKEWLARADAAQKAGRATEANDFRRTAQTLHSPRVPVEMTFNIYRTTKGRVGNPVLAEIMVTNPYTNQPPYKNYFPIHEYYTNKHHIPSRLFAGSMGWLKIEIRCLSHTQYLGMAESDLYILANAGKFGPNYMKGLIGVWLQALVLTAIGVFAGTFLSWPVALLTTVAFFVAGEVAFSFLLEFGRQSLLGGGPFESLFRLLTHDNQMSELSPTLAVVTARTFDSIVMPVMSRLVYVVPNFGALDVSNTVADGYEVHWMLLGTNLLLALAYALPFSIAGYFILKNREVAA